MIEQAPRPAASRPAPRPAEAKRWIYEQYDHLVGSRTVRRPGLDAAVLRLRPSYRGLAVSLQGPSPGERDPFRAGAEAVLGAARNVACAGGEPIGLTDCLNFGNPEKPPIAWELAQAIEGIAQAAEALGIPVVSGNVSLYNETDGRAIPPTPVVGCVGLVPDVRAIPNGWRPGDVILLACVPPDDLEAEAALIRFLWRSAPLLSLAHDVGQSGSAAARRGDGGMERPRGGRRRAMEPGPGTGGDRRLRAGERRAARLVAARDRQRRADVRRLRHPRSGPRRCARHALRAARAPAPRPGVGRDRGLRPRAADRPARPRARHPGLRRAEPERPARRARDRAHALLDHRLVAVDERPAPAAARQGAHRRARPQRQPHQRARAARGAARRGDPAGDDLRHRGDRRADRERPGAARGSGGQRDGAARRAPTPSSRSPVTR